MSKHAGKDLGWLVRITGCSAVVPGPAGGVGGLAAGSVTQVVYDLAVIGAGPAGAAAALACLQQQPAARVLLCDAATFPRDKVCGDGISGHALDLLDALGVGQVTADYQPIHQLHLRSPHGVHTVGALARPARVIPRTVFDARLVDAALARGAELVHRRVRRIEQRDGYVVLDNEIAARALVGADGANSLVRGHLGASAGRMAVAIRGYARTGAAGDELLIAVVERHCPAYAWSFPTGTGTSNIGFGVFDERVSGGRRTLVDRLAAEIPGQYVDPATLRGHRLPLTTGRPRLADGRILLAGDAAGLVNPLTGEGIHYALLSGALAGRAALTGPRAGRTYRQALHRRLRRHLTHTAVLARCLRSPRFVDVAFSAARRRHVFDTIVELGLGEGVAGPGMFAALAAHYGLRMTSELTGQLRRAGRGPSAVPTLTATRPDLSNRSLTGAGAR